MKIHNPPMQFSENGESIWSGGLTKNSDPYGNAVYRFASEWATHMEQRIAAGESLESAAKKASSDANDEGITGFMYGCAVSLLSACWTHGEALRRWHNLDMQIGDEGQKANIEGGVINPALLNIG